MVASFERQLLRFAVPRDADGEVDTVVAQKTDERGLDRPRRRFAFDRPDVIFNVKAPGLESTAGVHPYAPSDLGRRTVEIQSSAIGVEVGIRSIAAELADERLGRRGGMHDRLPQSQSDARQQGA